MSSVCNLTDRRAYDGCVPTVNAIADVNAEASSARRNVLLGALPPRQLGRLLPDLEPVSLPRGTVLDQANQEIEHVYFPISGIASLVAVGENGESVDTTMVGREGMTGLAVFLGTGQMPVETMVQLPFEGYRCPRMRCAPSWRSTPR
jgi:hypothetical protein